MPISRRIRKNGLLSSARRRHRNAKLRKKIAKIWSEYALCRKILFT